MASPITGVSRLFAQPLVQAQIKTIKTLRHWPLWAESTGDPHWIPPNKMFTFGDIIMSPRLVMLCILVPLRWRHNDHDSVSNHQPHGCLLNRLFRRRSEKTSKFRVTGLCVGNSPGPVNSPHKGPVTRKMLPFDEIIVPTNYSYTISVYLTHYGLVTQ